jgi:hypothetical protein
MSLSRQAIPVAIALAVLSLAGAAHAATPRGDWSTWGNSTLRNGVATISNVRAASVPKLALVWSKPLDAVSTAQPLFIADTRGGEYIAATAAGTISAYAATNGAVRWRAHLGSQTSRCTQLPKGQFGITGTPVYDRATATVYAVTHGVMYGLDVATGKPRTGYPLILPMDPFHEHVWGALTLRGNALYMATAAFCDVQPWKGKVIRIDLTTLAASEWDAVPTPGNNGGGGVFGWGGVSIDPKTGNVWVATANATGPDVPDDSAFDAESIVELTPTLQKLQSAHAPGMPLHGDYGFGSTPTLFKPTGCQPLAAAEAKNGSMYIWQREKLTVAPQRLQIAFPATLFGLPAWDPRTQTLFVTTTQGYNGYHSGLLAFRANSACRFALAWRQGLGSLLDSVPTVVNDTVMVGTGTGKIRVFSTEDGSPLLTMAAGGPVFAPPMSVGDDVAVSAFGKRLSVFRIAK